MGLFFCLLALFNVLDLDLVCVDLLSSAQCPSSILLIMSQLRPTVPLPVPMRPHPHPPDSAAQAAQSSSSAKSSSSLPKSPLRHLKLQLKKSTTRPRPTRPGINLNLNLNKLNPHHQHIEAASQSQPSPKGGLNGILKAISPRLPIRANKLAKSKVSSEVEVDNGSHAPPNTPTYFSYPDVLMEEAEEDFMPNQTSAFSPSAFTFSDIDVALTRRTPRRSSVSVSSRLSLSVGNSSRFNRSWSVVRRPKLSSSSSSSSSSHGDWGSFKSVKGKRRSTSVSSSVASSLGRIGSKVRLFRGLFVLWDIFRSRDIKYVIWQTWQFLHK